MVVQQTRSSHTRARLWFLSCLLVIARVAAAAAAGDKVPERTGDVPGLAPGAECPDPGPGAAAQMAAAANATIPLKKGLTFSKTWKPNADDYEHECLEQIAEIDARSILTTSSCPIGPKHEPNHRTRRICWSDFLDSHLYVTSHTDGFPDTFVGALAFNLSLSSFAVLKKNGEAAHRYVQPDDDFHSVAVDIDGQLKSDGAGTFKVIVNDRLLELPTLEASYVNQRKGDIIRVKVLDDARFPLMVDYYMPTQNKFFITYTKISFPTEREIEKHLATDKHTDVYGIYFDFASDSLRRESQPVLREIAEAMKSHPDWVLSIYGHTDNIGVDAQNLDLSRRRALTVRNALVTQFNIAPARLSTNGFGASQPKESNDTDRGRARNRRVELVRQ
jgi:outer membrane protein OmpA-like peptidoglycan-associated protein